MKFLIDFLESKSVEKAEVFAQLKCTSEEAEILKYIVKRYINGDEEVVVADLLIEIYSDKSYLYLTKLPLVKNLLELGWIMQNSFHQFKLGEISGLELLNSPVSPSVSLLKLLEEGSLEMALPEIKPYTDHLEYLQDQFLRIDLYQKLNTIKHNYTQNSPSINRLKNKLGLLEKRIQERLKVSEKEIQIEKFFEEKKLSEKESIIFLALLKEEYSSGETSLRDMNTLIELVSFDEYERIKNRSLLEEGSRLIQENIIDYDEMLTPFGGISRSFYILEEVLQGIIHPQSKKKAKRLRLDMLVKEQDIFELIEPKTSIDDVVLHPKTKETLSHLMQQVDKRVASLLKEWGIKDKKKGIDARIMFYGPPGTGKTLTALSLARSLKKQVLSFDCSKILSMYVGESEKNVRKIFDTYRDLASKAKSDPVLLLNEADQFLSSRTVGAGSSADKMHNQMQNIFLEQIERFEGILIATTNLLETIDPAFSRRFNYKIEFKRPDFAQRVLLWKKMLPANAPFEEDFDVSALARYNLTGGQINLIIKNTAYRVATKKEPLFRIADFVTEIEKEISGTFDSEKMVGFLG